MRNEAKRGQPEWLNAEERRQEGGTYEMIRERKRGGVFLWGGKARKNIFAVPENCLAGRILVGREGGGTLLLNNSVFLRQRFFGIFPSSDLRN
jgi:hypothetical protein